MVNIFNAIELGMKIRSERKANGYSLDDLREITNISRQTLAKWERGEGTGPTVDDLLSMCKAFQCDFGYLVGEYSCKTRQATDIQKETGLSETAVNSLIKLGKMESRFISDMLENVDSFAKISKKYCEYIDTMYAFCSKTKTGLTTWSGNLEYEVADGTKVNAPFNKVCEYLRFEFLHEITNFIEKNHPGAESVETEAK